MILMYLPKWMTKGKRTMLCLQWETSEETESQSNIWSIPSTTQGVSEHKSDLEIYLLILNRRNV